jgi:hypothetical protein
MNNNYVIVILCILAILNYINVNYDYFANTKCGNNKVAIEKTCCPDKPTGWEVIQNECYLNCILSEGKKCGFKGKEQYKIATKDNKKCCIQKFP